MSNKKQLRIVSAIGLLLLVAAVAIYYTFVVFHISSTNPQQPTLPTTQNFIVISFNKHLKPNQGVEKKMTIHGIGAAFSQQTDTITVSLTSLAKKGTVVTIDMKDIISETGDTYSGSLRYTADYVPFDALSGDTKKRLVAQTDDHEKSHPLINVLPREDADFSINYTLPTNGNDKIPLFISSKAINYADPMAPADAPSSMNVLRAARQKAMTWLRSNGYNDKEYILVFSEPYLLDEFGGVYAGTFQADPVGD